MPPADQPHLVTAAARTDREEVEVGEVVRMGKTRGGYLRAAAPGIECGAPFSVGPVMPTLEMPEVVVTLTLPEQRGLVVDVPATYHPSVTPGPDAALRQAYDASEQECRRLREALELETQAGHRLRASVEAYSHAETQLSATLELERAELNKAWRDIEALRDAGVPTQLSCPTCHAQHVDEGEWATLPHRTHECQECGKHWRPYPVATFGIAPAPLEQGLSWEEWAVLTAFRETKHGPALRMKKEGTADVVELLSLNFDRFLGHVESIRDEAQRAAMIETMDRAFLEQGGVYLKTDG